jgi:Tfp pilus assembly major pilin PilA
MQPGSPLAALCLRPAVARRARGAISLVEIMLVMVIIVIAGAVAMPNSHNTLRRQRLKSAAETMRIEWSRAHVKAMKTGRILVFRYELDGNQFSLQPWVAGDEATEGESEGVEGFGVPAEMPSVEAVTKKLDDGIKFAAGEAKFESRSYEIENLLQNNGSGDGANWSRPILFYPDGSATDAYVIVADERQDAYRVKLRGLTGTSQMSDEKKLDDLLAAIETEAASEVLP